MEEWICCQRCCAYSEHVNELYEIRDCKGVNFIDAACDTCRKEVEKKFCDEKNKEYTIFLRKEYILDEDTIMVIETKEIVYEFVIHPEYET